MPQASPDLLLPWQRSLQNAAQGTQGIQPLSHRHSTARVCKPRGSTGTACQAEEQQCERVGLGSHSLGACPGLCSNVTVTCFSSSSYPASSSLHSSFLLCSVLHNALRTALHDCNGLGGLLIKPASSLMRDCRAATQALPSSALGRRARDRQMLASVTRQRTSVLVTVPTAAESCVV